MEDEVKDVNSAPSPEPEATETNANPTPEGQTETPAPEGQKDVKQDIEPAVDDTYWKNRAMEAQRKLEETVHSIPKVIQDTLAQAKQPAKQEYTVEQLEVFAEQTDDVQSKLWARQKIRELERSEREQEYNQLVEKERFKITSEQRRQAAEVEVINDPRFQEAFQDAGGRKVWNPNSKLTLMASQYLQDPALSNRPDALPIAMKLAYADYVLEKNGKVATQVTTVKRENAKLKQQTLVEGGISSNNAPVPDMVTTHMNDLAKTGSKSALRALTQEVLRQQGVFK
jgi:hypothetical protein